MRRVLAAALAVSFTLGAGASPALAQDTPAEREKKARKHYEDGITQYNINNFPTAIEEFKRAYELTRAPALLFNIAQAYRLGKDCANAQSFYRTYLREVPGASNRKDAEDMLREVDACVKAAAATPTPQPQPQPVAQPVPQPQPVEPAPQPQPMPVAPDGPADSGKTLRLAGWVTGGVGVAALGVGIIYGLKAKSTQSDYDKCLEITCADLSDLESQGNSQEDIAVGGLVVGGALLAAGATMVILGWPSSSGGSDSAVTLAPTADGGAFVWAGRF